MAYQSTKRIALSAVFSLSLLTSSFYAVEFTWRNAATVSSILIAANLAANASKQLNQKTWCPVGKTSRSFDAKGTPTHQTGFRLGGLEVGLQSSEAAGKSLDNKEVYIKCSLANAAAITAVTLAAPYVVKTAAGLVGRNK